jgi:bifunctional DNA-binding transcriptional regulator/antitoxin component of YhaV-PrlF toxin-antitoxin module
LYDSLELAKTLYPDLLNYIGDTTMDLAIVALTKTMIDSNQLSMDILSPVKTELIKLAKKYVRSVNSDEYGFNYEIPALIELLGYFKHKDANDAAAIFLKAKDLYVKKSAALTLIKNNRPVAASVLSKIANDQQYRVGLYDELRKAGKEKLFPADLRSQVGLAEGYIVNAIYDEEEDETIPEMIFIKRIEYNYKGTKKAFYIFRANYEYEMEEGGEVMDTTVQLLSNDTVTEANTATESYLTVAGPFDLNKSELLIDEKENITGMWYDDKFDGMKIDYFFRKYVEQRLKWQEERKKK